MIPTVEAVYGRARAHLGDTQDQDGETYFNQILEPFYVAAYEELFAAMRESGIPSVGKTIYHNLLAREKVLTVARLGIFDMGEPKALWERGGVGTPYGIQSTSAAAPIVVTTTISHPFNTGDEAVVSQAAKQAANGRWFVEKTGANTLLLLGSYGTEAGGAAGTITRSTERFAPMSSPDDLPERDPGPELLEYDWHDDTFFFVGATEVRQLKIEYSSSGNAPLTGSTGLDGALNFLGARTAAGAVGSRGQKGRAGELLAECYGTPGRVAGFLDNFLCDAIKSMQRTCYQPPAYRRQRVRY